VSGGFRDPTWAYGLFTGIIVVSTYALTSFLGHSTSFRALQFSFYLGDIAAAVGFGLCCLLMCAMIYRRIVSRQSRLRPAILMWILVVSALSGATFNLLPASSASAPESVNIALERLPGASEDVPLLFIGLDGGTWRLLDRALRDGHAPTLRDLVSRGSTGTIEALWPPHWSGAAWAAIVTGLPRETHGVYEDLAAVAPGLPTFQIPLDPDTSLYPFYSVRSLLKASGVLRFTPPPRRLLRGKPIWQLLHEGGVETAVVRFRFTYPPQGQAGIVVSDWVGKDQWENLGVRRLADSATVTPPNRADELLAPFRSAAPSDPALFARLLPGPPPERPRDSLLDPIEELRIASDIDDRTFNVSESILSRRPNQSFLAVYIGGLDSVEHAFWPYRFPEDFPRDPPAKEDVERLGPVVDRYVRYVDERLRRLLALYDNAPNVLIVSDHGHGAADGLRSWRGWHTRDGIYLAAGPSVPRRPERTAVSYYDVLPAIARMKGFRPVRPASTPAFRQ
jgi:hypothetical protein